MGMGGVCGWAGGGRGEGGETATDNIELQNSQKQSLLSGLDQEHPLLGTPMRTLSWNFTDVTDSTVTSGRRSVLGPAPSLTSDG